MPTPRGLTPKMEAVGVEQVRLGDYIQMYTIFKMGIENYFFEILKNYQALTKLLLGVD